MEIEKLASISREEIASLIKERTVSGTLKWKTLKGKEGDYPNYSATLGKDYRLVIMQTMRPVPVFKDIKEEDFVLAFLKGHYEKPLLIIEGDPGSDLRKTLEDLYLTVDEKCNDFPVKAKRIFGFLKKK